MSRIFWGGMLGLGIINLCVLLSWGIDAEVFGAATCKDDCHIFSETYYECTHYDMDPTDPDDPCLTDSCIVNTVYVHQCSLGEDVQICPGAYNPSVVTHTQEERDTSETMCYAYDAGLVTTISGACELTASRSTRCMANFCGGDLIDEDDIRQPGNECLILH